MDAGFLMSSLFTWRTARWICLALILLAGSAWGWRWRSKRLLTRELTEYAILLQQAYEASATTAPAGVPCTEGPAKFLDRFAIDWNGTHHQPVKFARIELDSATFMNADGRREELLCLFPDGKNVVDYLFGIPISSHYEGYCFEFRKVNGRWSFDFARFFYLR